MASTTVINGTAVALYIQGTTVAQATSCQLTVEQNVIETTSKNSGGWFDGIAGLRNISLSVEGWVHYVQSYGLKEITALIVSRTLLAWIMRTTVTGDTVYSGSGFVTSVNSTYPVEDASNYTAEITGVGALVTTVV